MNTYKPTKKELYLNLKIQKLEIERLNNIINKYKKWLKEMSEYDSHLRGTENDRFIYSNCKYVLDILLDRKRYTNQTNSEIIYEEFI